MGLKVLDKGTSITGRFSGQARATPFGAWSNYENLYYSRFNQVSFNHPGPPYSEAGPWYLERTFDIRNSYVASSNWIQGSYGLGGANFTVQTPTQYHLLTDQEINVFGAQAFQAGASAASPQSDLPVFMGELLRDGVPSVTGSSLWREKTNAARKASGEYLNIEFGWKPLVADIKRFARVVNQADKLWRNYTRSANRYRNVSRVFPSYESVYFGTGSFTILPSAVGVFAQGNLKKRSNSATWFEGRFRYYLDNGSDFDSRFRRFGSKARYLLGVRLTPDVVWNLAPWSWAADWAGNFGTVLSNISVMGSDGVVCSNGCLMHQIQRLDEAHAIPNANTRGISSSPLYFQTGSTFKTRVMASPFGFGKTFESFTPRQLAISAAIGLSLGGSGKAY